MASFTESLSLCLGFLARANRLSAQTWTGTDGSVPPSLQASQGRRSAARRRSGVGGRRRRTTGSGGAAGDAGATGGGWAVAVDLRKVDALLTMLKQLDDQESAGYLMGAGNQVSLEQGVRMVLGALLRGSLTARVCTITACRCFGECVVCLGPLQCTAFLVSLIFVL